MPPNVDNLWVGALTTNNRRFPKRGACDAFLLPVHAVSKSIAFKICYSEATIAATWIWAPLVILYILFNR